MTLHIKNVEHLTVQIGDKPANPFSAMLSKMLATSMAESAKGPQPGTATAGEAPPAGTAQTTARNTPPAIGQVWNGGIYAGVSRGENDQPDAHLVLLADKPAGKLNWSDAVEWAESLGDGARLPTRFESALLYAHVQDQLDTESYHWTGTQYSDYYAWTQDFYDGNQGNDSKSFEARCRAVRRFAL